MKLFGLILICLVAACVIVYFARATTSKRLVPGFIPDPTNDKELIVKGWTEEELRQIMAHFEKMYQGRLGAAFSVSISRSGTDVRLRFPQDIPAVEFCFLVNYVQYPEGFDLKGRLPTVFAKTTLSRDFNLPEESLLGQKAIIYVPANDTAFDVVYVTTGGRTFENSFASQSWKAVADPRIPSGIPVALF